ncbi:MAG: hypothetical protein K2N84_04235 [Clostridia bacterium]|nr:hypothetical protein [Clostridia bacterium]
MKKLKVVLLALLATTLSVGLIACRKPDKKPDDQQEQPSDTKKIDRIIFSGDTASMTITDADTEDMLVAKLKSDLSISVHYVGAANEKYDATDCDYDTSAVSFGEVGNYTVKVTPKSHNPVDKDTHVALSKDLDVYITHHFEDDVCTVDGATRTTQEIDVGLEYKLFHTGDAIYTPADDVSGAAIHPFGSIMVDGKEETVKTYSVGRLEKGMSITVKGTAKTTYDEHKVEDKQYYFPILGFADTSRGTYTGGAGTAIIVRNEGWVLLDGIGTPRLLAGNAAGGGGANDSGNYGSHPEDQGTKPAGYNAHGMGTPSLDQWQDWYTYSTGVISRSSTYATEQEVEFTWTYLNNGIIELVFKNNTAKINLTARTKVPDSSKGYYDTILHGEYVRMKFSEITTISSTTLTGVTYDGVKSDARKIWLDNEMLDLSVFNVSITTEQNPDPATDTQFDIEANIGTEKPEWVSLSTTPLDGAKMKAFRVIRTMGNVTKADDIDISNFITIKTNAVDRAVPYTVNYGKVLFENNSSVKVTKLETAVNGNDATAKIIVAGGANTLSDKQIEALEDVTAAKYIAIRLWAREGASANFTGATPAIKSGSAALAGAKAIVSDNGKYVDLIIPVDASVRTNGVVVSGLVEGGVDVTIDLSGIESISVTSKVEKGTIYLNKGGDVTVTYTMSAEEYANVTDDSRIYVNSASARLSALRGEVETGYDKTGTVGSTKVSIKRDEATHTVTVKYTLPKFSIDNIEKFDLVLQDENNNMLARDTVYYDLGMDEDDPAVIDGIFYTEANGATLKIAFASPMNDIHSEYLDFGGLYISLNNGSIEGLVYKEIGFAIKNGNCVFYDKDMEGVVTPKITYFGTLDNSDDVDYGIAFVLEVDLTKLGVTKAPYYFDLSVGETGAPEKVHQVTEDGVTAIAVTESSLGERTLIQEGSCLEVGYAAYPYMQDGKVVFYAGMAKIGGEHDFNGEGVCRYCGATQATAPIPAWAETKAETIHKGEVITLEGSYLEYLEGASSGDFYVGITLQVITQADGTFLWVRSDRYAEIVAGGNWDNRRVITEAEGTAVDYDGTEFPTNADWLRYRTVEGARIVITMTLDDGVLTIIERNYSPLAEDASELFYSVKYEFLGLTADSYQINLTRDHIALRGDVTLTRAKLAPNSVSEITSSNVTIDGVEFAAANVDYTVNGTSGKYVTVGAVGAGSKLTEAQAQKLGVSLNDYKYYTTVKVSLDNPLDAGIWNGQLNGAKGKVVIDGKDIYAVIAVNGEGGNAIVDIWNFYGIMTESDVKIDLSNISCSDVGSTLNASGLSVLGGTATVTYTGAPEGAAIEIDGKSFTLAELATEKDYENGVKATYASNVLTLTVAKPDYTKEIPTYAVNLRDGDGKLLAQSNLALNTLPATGTNVEGTHIIADGAKLTLILTDGVAASNGKVTKELYLNANVGKTTKLENLRLYDLSFAVESNGVVAFTAANAITGSANIVYSSIGIVAITADLSAIEIAEDAAYGFEVRFTNGAKTDAFAVAADRTIAPIAGISATDATTELQAHSCDAVGLAAAKYPASGDATFYYNISVTSSHTWGAIDEKGFSICSVCGATLKSGVATNVTVVAANLAGVATDGLTVSFVAINATGDWASQALVTKQGNMIITLPNLDPWNNNVAGLEGATDREKELAAKVKGSNCFPAADNKMNNFEWNCYIGKEVYATVTVSKTDGISYYVNGVLAIQYPATKVVGKGTVADFAELFLLLTERTGLIVAQAGVGAQDMLAQKGVLTEAQAKTRYENYIAEKNVLPTPAAAPTHPEWNEDPAQGKEVKLGAADNSTGYTTNMLQLPLTKGEKLVLTGTMTSVADANTAANWNALVATLYTGMVFAKGVFRADNYIIDGEGLKADNGWEIAQNSTIAVNDAKEPTLEGDNAFWASMRAILNKCDVTVTLDYSDASKIIMTFVYESTTEGYENTYTQSYTITSASGKLADEYTVGLGVDGCYAVFSNTTRTTAE